MCPVGGCPVPVLKMYKFINRISNPLRIWKDVCLFIQMNIHAHNGNVTTAAQKNSPTNISLHGNAAPRPTRGLHDEDNCERCSSAPRKLLNEKTDNTLHNAWKFFSQLKASLMHAKLNERLESGGLMSRNKRADLFATPSISGRCIHPHCKPYNRQAFHVELFCLICR